MSTYINNVGSVPYVYSDNSLLLGIDSSQPDNNPLDVADILSLSPQAQSYIDFTNLVSNTPADPALGGAALNLSDDQKAKFDATIDKYKDAPFTHETYVKILNDLAAQGLSAEQIALQSAPPSFDLSAILLDTLSGENSSSSNVLNLFTGTQQAQTVDFNQQVVAQWESVSTQYNPSEYIPLIA
jgi:hypothetical protein